mgnify:CR=1 FL=1|jgi:hypothetical protein
MSLLIYIAVSTLEYLSLFVFILVQFRFSLKDNISQIALISLLLSFVSYSIVNADMREILPLIQIVFVLLYMQLVMKVSFINALIMFFTGYIVFGLAQTCIVAVARHIGYIHDKLMAGTTVGYTIQLITILVMLVFSFALVYFKGGFSFIEARSRLTRKSFTGKNKIFISFIIFAFIVTIITNIIFLEKENPPLIEVASIFFVLMIFLFYLSIKRDEVNDRDSLQSSSRQIERD